MIVAKCFHFTMFKLDIKRRQLASKFCKFGNVILKLVTTHANVSIYYFGTETCMIRFWQVLPILIFVELTQAQKQQHGIL